MPPTRFADVERAAWMQNRWGIIAIVQVPQRAGEVPHGHAVVHRANHPLGPDRAWAIVSWADHGHGGGDPVTFFSGDYDLTFVDAMHEFVQRSRPFPVGPNMDLRAAYPALALIHEQREDQ